METFLFQSIHHSSIISPKFALHYTYAPYKKRSLTITCRKIGDFSVQEEIMCTFEIMEPFQDYIKKSVLPMKLFASVQISDRKKWSTTSKLLCCRSLWIARSLPALPD